MMDQINSIRKWLLTVSLIFLTLPGFAGLEMSISGIRLGRFQPFKFLFITWLLSQGLWIIHKNLSIKQWHIWIAFFIFNLCLGLSILIEKGGLRGGSIWFSLLLGQIGFLLCVSDDEFPTESLLNGLAIAAFILVGFGAAELLCPHSKWVLAFLKLVRDDPQVSYQLGSTLSTAALAEFTVRSLPLVLLFSLRRWSYGFAALSLTVLSILTLERSAIVSVFLIFLIASLSDLGKLYRKKALIVFLFLFGVAFFIQGPEKILGRYLGDFLSNPNGNNWYNRATQQSTQERKELLKLALHTIKTKPLLGIGLDGFACRVNPMKVPSHTHNLLLEIGVSGGIFALISFLFLLASYGFGGWKTRNWPALIYLAGQSISILTDSRIYVSWLAITFFWFAGMAWAVGRRSNIFIHPHV